ncbi:MAG: SAM-dependent methyltransferase [Caldimonas sp.]
MPGYLTKQETIEIVGSDDLVVCSLLDRQQFSDPLGVARGLGISPAMWSLFGVPWPSGARLAARLMARPSRPGERILEIGCGLALASLAAHRRGDDVTASDCHPLAETFLARNLRLNGLAPIKYRHGRWGGEPMPVSEGGAMAAAVTGRFDLVIGSDVLYERDADGTLAAFIAEHAAATAEVWIADPDRGNRAAFNRRMAEAGFTQHDERLDQAATARSPAYKGRLLVYRRCAAS